MIQPLRDRILVKPIERTKSDILAVIMQENFNMGEVVAVGPGEYDKKGRRVPNPCEVGQKIRYGTTGEYLTFQEVDPELDNMPPILLNQSLIRRQLQLKP